jgi:hypothetical protein
MTHDHDHDPAPVAPAAGRDSQETDAAVAGAAGRAERSWEEVLSDAVRVLTEAARLSRPVLAHDRAASEAAGQPVWTETGRREPADWAEFVTHALAGAAANIGSIGAALAGRPGSWEADGVRDLLYSTVGHDEENLLGHQTEPVTVELHVDPIMLDAGVWQSYDAASAELARRDEQIDTTPGLTAAERERRYDAVAELDERLEQQRREDWAGYGQALTAAVHAAAARRYPDLRVPVEVHVYLDTYPDPRADTGYDSPADLLRADAIAATSLPGDSQPPLERLAPTTDPETDPR